MKPGKKTLDEKALGHTVCKCPGSGVLPWLFLSVSLSCGFPALAQPQINRSVMERGLPGATGTATTARDELPDKQLAGTISGTVFDVTGAVVAHAVVKLSQEGQSQGQGAVPDDDGQFSLANIAPGPFQLTILSEGFAPQTYSGILHSGENHIVPAITLIVAASSVEVQVSLSRSDLAKEELKDEEKQRVFGVIPNFYVTYNPNAVSLQAKQKFELAWKSTVDPVNFALSGVTAGIQQATNAQSGYGQGAQGYAKRYAANYADLVTSNFVGSAMLPVLFKQDPRYFYKGSGSIRSRILYAIAHSVACKGDDGHWQPNYSGIVGGLASGEISRLYRPETDRRGVGSTFENALIVIASTAADNLLQEFLIRKLTRHPPSYTSASPDAR
jgi:hypothetical protein